jgi:hypothetical protein
MCAKKLKTSNSNFRIAQHAFFLPKAWRNILFLLDHFNTKPGKLKKKEKYIRGGFL